MMIHDITARVGTHKKRKRIGRGPGSGHGKTAGRGHKGAGSRAGWNTMRRAGYEGGQMPFFRRFAKRGFTNAQFRKEFAIINVKVLNEQFEDGATVDAAALVKHGLMSDTATPVKVLGEGELTRKLTVVAAAFSKSAEEKITKAGGTCTVG